jgi:hypothetical protein
VVENVYWVWSWTYDYPSPLIALHGRGKNLGMELDLRQPSIHRSPWGGKNELLHPKSNPKYAIGVCTGPNR